MAVENQGSHHRLAEKQSDPFRWVAAATTALLLVLGLPALQAETRFFEPAAVIGANGSAPVPQDGDTSLANDKAFRLAASILPAGSTCIIAVDAWNGDYFRASYILMPRHVWPYVNAPESGTPTATALSAALATHGATCLLVGRHTAVPTRARRLTTGAYSLYIVPIGGRA
jgi:hypothetical protein